jgi:hypothetical protein
VGCAHPAGKQKSQIDDVPASLEKMTVVYTEKSGQVLNKYTAPTLHTPILEKFIHPKKLSAVQENQACLFGKASKPRPRKHTWLVKCKKSYSMATSREVALPTVQ